MSDTLQLPIRSHTNVGIPKSNPMGITVSPTSLYSLKRFMVLAYYLLLLLRYNQNNLKYQAKNWSAKK